jgi:HAD superfamily, subfamily IIIB (Acid phosphatase)
VHAVKAIRRRSPRLVVIGVLVALIAAAVAYAATGPAIQTITPQHADDVTNIDVLRQQIRNYYGDPLGTGVFAPDGNYAKEASSVASSAMALLTTRGSLLTPAGKRAIVFDVDDTTLATWNYEIASNWAYNPTTNATFVTEQRFPAVPGMVELAWYAKTRGYSIFWITGRPATQEADTLGNLTHDGVGVDAGYPAPTTLKDGEDGLFTKPALADYPQYLKTACGGASCSTIQYKSATRAHIESLGYRIVANFGDQYSDLTGGYADNSFKMPNPNYFLP